MPTQPADFGADDAVASVLLARLLADRESGEFHPIEFWIAAFPGYEDLVRSEFARLNGNATVAEGPATAPLAFGPFSLLRRLGSGGFGTVWLATDTRNDRTVALKLLRGIALESETARARFRREAEALQRVSHPGISAIHDAGVSDDVPWIAMQFVDGVTLAEQFRRGIPDRASLLGVIESVARALHAAHVARVIHRDLKPANIMLVQNGAPILIDFGLARDLDDTALTRSFELLGTLAYMAPEQLDRSAPVGVAADVWGLGVTLWQGLTGDLPHKGTTADALLQSIRRSEPPDPRRLRHDIPAPLATIAMVALDPDPTRRFASAQAFADDLERLREGRGVTARAAGPVVRLTRFARRSPVIAGLVVTLVVAAAVTPFVLRTVTDVAHLRSEAEATAAAKLRAGTLERAFEDLESQHARTAAASFRKVLAEDPRSVEALVGLSSALARLDDHAGMLAELEPRADLRARAPALDFYRADALRALGRTADATAVERSIPESSEPMDLWIRAIRELVQGELKGDAEALERSLDLVSRAALNSPTANPAVWFLRAEVAAISGHATEARDSAAALQRLWPESPTALFFAGFALHGAGDAAAAIAPFTKALAADPTNTMKRDALAAAYDDSGHKSEAAIEYRRVLAVDIDDRPANVGLANHLLASGDAAEAARLLARALASDPEWHAKRALRIEALLAAKMPTEAEAEAVELMRRTNGKDATAYKWLALAARAAGNTARALDAARRGVIITAPDEGDDEQLHAEFVKLVADLERAPPP